MTKMTPELAGTMSAAEQHEWFHRKTTSRRALLRGGLVGAGAIGAAAVLPGTASAAPGASLLARASRPSGDLVVPFGRHLAFGADAQRQLRVSWQVPALVRRPFVRIGPSPWDLGERIDADLQAVTTPRSIVHFEDDVSPNDSGDLVQYYAHAELDHLRPGRTYYYVVGHDGWDARGNPTTVRSFTTGPARADSFTFTAFGDQGISYDAVATTNLIRAQNPAFHLHAGDISYAESGGGGGITDDYDPRQWDSFFNQVEPVASEVPWQVAMGNHEMETWYSPDTYGAQFKRFALADRAYYSFMYGNVAVLSLDANDVSNEIPANRGYSAGQQTAWLDKQLAAYRKRPDIDFVVAYFHHCAYCTCDSHSSEGGARTNWAPLFDKYSVDLVINGHNHIYERTDPIKGGIATGRAPIGATVHPAEQGTTYITAGGGGASLYEFTASDSYAGHVKDDDAVPAYVNDPGGQTKETVNWSRVRYTGYCLLVIDSQPVHRTLTIRGLSGAGQELDRVTLRR